MVGWGPTPAETAAAVERVRAVAGKPVIVKLTPTAANPAGVPAAAEDAGADAISLINTLRGMALDPRTRRPWLGRRARGAFRPPGRPAALEPTPPGFPRGRGPPC